MPTTAAHRARAADRLFWIGAGALALGLVVAIVTRLVPPDLVLVVGGWVPRWWPIELVLVGAGLGILFASVLRRSAHPTDVEPPRPLMPTRGRRWVVGLLTTALVCCSIVGCGLVGLLGTTTSYTVLSPASAAGCRVVVGEDSFLFVGGGTLYVLPDGHLVPTAVDTYGSDDGYEPISEGTYRLGWEGEKARLELWGEPGQETAYDGTLSCA